ncbi:MAG: FliM/FliN family flagellar motor C-terminal domain-containing protein [Aquabacterium sp.]
MSAESTRDLFLVRDEERQAVQTRVRDALLAWAKEWVPQAATWVPALDVSCATESEIGLPTAAWQARGRAASASAGSWAQVGDAARRRLASMLVGRESTSPLADADWAVQAAAAAWDDLNTRLLGTAMEADAAQPDLARLSGAIVVRETSLDVAWVWARSAYAQPAGTGANVIKATAGVAALTGSLGAQSVPVRAGLGEVDIAMADLLALQVGDVIRFPIALEGLVPLHIGAQAGTPPAAQAQLGQMDGHVAVKLVSKHSAA